MPNICEFDMRVRGDAGGVERFERAATEYDEARHLWRIFTLDEIGREDNADGTVAVTYEGECAWSVYSCMCEGPHTYARYSPERSTTLQRLSAELDLDIEVYSREPGVGFSEHYLYRKGQEEAAEETEYSEWWYDPAAHGPFAKYAEEYGVPAGVTEDRFDDDGVYAEGGYETVWNI